MINQSNATTTPLPHECERTFLMDGGMETSLIFQDGIDLPYFAAFPLLQTEAGREALARYYRNYLDVARHKQVGFVLETPTWRASPDWGALLGFDSQALDEVNRQAVAFIRELAGRADYAQVDIVLSGCIGPRGDGYAVGTTMSVEEARAYHAPQASSLVGAGVRLVSGLTMTYAEEAAGIALAARDAGGEAVISFTVETDGHLPSGMPLPEAINRIDQLTDAAPAYFMVNCAHPEHFDHVLADAAEWTSRIGGIRANASRMSHAELDEAEELDAGNPVELGSQYAELRRLLPKLNVMGGCCGTDHRHVAQIAEQAA